MTTGRYLAIKFDNIDANQVVLNTLQQAVLATLILQEVGNILSDPTVDLVNIVESWAKHVADLVRSLLAQPPPASTPARADMYLLQSVHPHQQLLKVLKSNDLLQKLNIPQWFVNESIINRVNYEMINLKKSRYSDTKLLPIFVYG